MPRILSLLLVFILVSCSIEKSMSNAEFDAVINKLGSNPAKNTVTENIMVGDAYRQSNRIVEAIPFYQEALKAGTAEEEVNLYVARGLKVEQRYNEAKKVLNGYLPRAKSEKVKELAQKELNNLNKIDALEKDSSYYRVKNLSDINTKSAEYSPVYSNQY